MTDDALLGALDQLTNAVDWHRGRTAGLVPVTAVDALVEALDDWLGEHAAEHHQSLPFSNHTNGGDPLGTVLTHLVAAVAELTGRSARPDLTVTAAFTEAVAEWVAAESAEHHHSEPLQRAPG